jgi:glucose-6-phosphate isomerase
MGREPLLRFALGAALPSDEGNSIEAIVREYATELTAAAATLARGGAGMGWISLPDRDTEALEEAAEWGRGFDALVQVGIGGSALGNLTLHQALLPDLSNEGGRVPRFYLLDNPDPWKVQAVRERVRGTRWALAVVSKSGSTAESAAQFARMGADLAAEGGEEALKERTIVVTDPQGGILREFARQVGCRSLEIPSDVGGRYSVLSPVGLFSAATLGISPTRLLAGAGRMRDRLDGLIGTENPAWILAAVNLHHARKGRNISVLMPYSGRLATFAEWFAQLWGESLGKKGKGTTPVRALGAVDQHSQVQLYVEGPDDKFYTLIEVTRHPEELPIPGPAQEALSPFGYLEGKGLGELLNLEARATAAALEKAGRPLVYVTVPELNEESLGALIFFYQYLTALTGLAAGIDPFDQPGVEQGKRYAYGLLGRPGYEKEAAEVAERSRRMGTIEISV